MKDFLLKNKVTIILCSVILILLIGIFEKSFGMYSYESVEHYLGIVNTD